MDVPTGWASWSDAQRLSYADSIIDFGQRVAAVGGKIRQSVEKAQQTIANMDSVGIELTAPQILQIRNKYVAENAAEFLALSSSVPEP